nr:hypothetical protein GCM10017547_31490 [Pseudarthrobacter oxydans]
MASAVYQDGARDQGRRSEAQGTQVLPANKDGSRAERLHKLSVDPLTGRAGRGRDSKFQGRSGLRRLRASDQCAVKRHGC